MDGRECGAECWELRSGAGVGPLQFGMSPTEVAQALLVPGPQERVGGPYVQEDFPDGVKAFYDAGTLACVALDAVIGPQVFLFGFPLAGSDPEQVQQFLLTTLRSMGTVCSTRLMTRFPWLISGFCCARSRSGQRA